MQYYRNLIEKQYRTILLLNYEFDKHSSYGENPFIRR